MGSSSPKSCQEMESKEDGRQGAFAAVRDIAESKKGGEALRQRDELYRDLYEHTPVMMHSIDSEGILISVNGYWLEALGYEVSEVIGRRSTEFLTEASRRFALEVALPEFLKTGVATNVSYQMVKKTGEVLDVLLSAVLQRDQSGEIEYTRAFAVDVTERKRAEEALRESAEKAQLLARENSVIAEIGRVISFSLDMHDVYEQLGHEIRKLIPFDRMMISMVDQEGESVSHAFVLGAEVPGRQQIPLAGTFVEEVIRRRSAVLLEEDKEPDLRKRYPGLLANFRDGMRSFLAAPLIYRGEVIGVLQVRSKKLGVYSQLHLDLAERVATQIAGAIANSQLFAQRQRAEETLRDLAVLEERNRIAREIHDTLAQSLVGIVMQVEAAGELMGEAPEAAQAKIESARNLAQESLDEARRSVGELQPSVLATSGLTEAVQQEVTKTGERGIQISLKISGEEPDLLDRDNKLAILRIVQEALSNIIRHARTKSASVRISYGPSALRLSVSDDGIGFDPSEGHAELSSTGAGFGLISMQERTRLAGGYIEIHSTPGVGTQVEATIPYQRNSGSPSSFEETCTTASLSNDGGPGVIRVLIADDHEVFRRGILNTIEQIDGIIVVGEAEDGEEALEKIQTLAPDVVLLDISMPKLDGVGTLRRVSELGLQTRVILLSAYATDEYIFDGLRAGAGGYLLKDVSRDELANAIRTVHEGGSLLHPVVAKRLIEQLDNKETSGLSDREIEVIMLLASGARNKEIATQLSVTIHTVKFHLDNVYRKLGVQTRAEAVRVASERGLLNA